MQAVLKCQFLILGLVADDQLQRQRFIHSHNIISGKRRETRCLRTVRQSKSHSDAAVGRRGELFQFPCLNARKSVLSHPFALAKPWKDDWNSAANWLPL